MESRDGLHEFANPKHVLYTCEVARLGGVRAELGIPRQRVARWARVSEDRIAAFEMDPETVGGERRERIARVYSILSDTLARLRRLGLYIVPRRVEDG